MIKSLTTLRGIFILFIFLHHCHNLYPGGGSMAVTFFFVLGGFSMALGYKDRVLKPEFSYREYIIRRGIKFYPLHWLCLLVAFPLSLLSFNLNQIPVLFANAALLQTWIPIQDVYFSFNWVSWYLADTMFFAVMFPLVFKLIVTSNNKGRIAVALFLAIIYACVALLLPVEKYHAILYISPYMRLTDFVFGIYLALLYFNLKEKPAKWWNGIVIGQLVIVALIVLLIVESCILPKNFRLVAPVYWLLVALLILMSSLIRQRGDIIFENKYMQRLGELSFIIFLIHQIILRYTNLLFDRILHFENDIIYFSITLALTLVLSLVVDKYILKPITQWLTKRIQPSMTAR